MTLSFSDLSQNLDSKSNDVSKTLRKSSVSTKQNKIVTKSVS